MANANVHEFGEDNWEAEVVGSDVPVLVDFWAPWCGPCRTLSPIIDKIANQFAGKVKVGKLNVDEHGELAVKYGITHIPRVMIFKGSDKPVHEIAGLVSEVQLSAALTKFV